MKNTDGEFECWECVGKKLFAIAFAVLIQVAAADDFGGWKIAKPSVSNAFDLALAPRIAVSELASIPQHVGTGKHRILRADAAQDLEKLLPSGDGSRIRELARGLDWNWQKCYRFVRDQVRFEPYFGILKGAERTLLDREGNDADQALLLLALLRESGYAATVKYVPSDSASGFCVPLQGCDGRSPYNAVSWMGLAETGDPNLDYQNVFYKLSAAKRPVGAVSDGETYYLKTDHFWVAIMMDGEPIDLDPSLKPHDVHLARNVLADCGYSKSEFLSVAGGMTAATSVSDLSVAGIEALMNGYAAALAGVWTNANASAINFVGRKSIVAQSDDFAFHGLLLANGETLDFLSQPHSFRNSFRARAMFSHGNFAQSFYLDEIGARNLWVSYQSLGTGLPRAVLHLDDVTLAEEPGTIHDSIVLSPLTVAYTNQSTTAEYGLCRSVDNVYSICVGFGGDSRDGMRRHVSDVLAGLVANGVPESDPRAVACAVNLAGQGWISQTVLLKRLFNRRGGGEVQGFYSVGIAAQDGSSYLDIGNYTAYQTTVAMPFRGGTFFDSALEHACLDQLNGTNRPSVSTVKLLELAHETGVPVHFATSANYNSVESRLVGYSSALKNRFREYVNAGYSLLLPQSGALSLGDWTGYGYSANYYTDYGYSTVMMKISGGLNGGYGTVPGPVSTQAYSERTSDRDVARTSGGSPVAADPVAMPSGAFLDQVEDLRLLAGKDLVWSRFYDSRSRKSRGALGRGWSHGFEASVQETSDPDAVFGDGSVSAVIPTALAIAVVEDLLAPDVTLSAGENAKRHLLAALVVQWWTRLHTLATVRVALGAQTLSFQRRGDGTFAPQADTTASLDRTVDGYVLTERLGPTYAFDSSGRLVSVSDRSGNVTALTYADGRLASVSNSFGAVLDVAWDGDRIAAVSDRAGRRVSYGYDDEGFLTSVIDAAGKTWRMDYDSQTGVLASKIDPEGCTTVRNAVNSRGQVTNQVLAAGGVTSFGYVEGTAAWDADPHGNRLTRTFDADGRELSTVRRSGATSLSASDGHGHVVTNVDAKGGMRVSSYDARDNLVSVDEIGAGLVRRTSFGYDAINRLVAETNALGDVTTYEYDACDRLVRTVYPDGSADESAWTAQGLMAAQVRLSPGGAEVRRIACRYDTRGLPVSRTVTGIGLPADGVTETFVYDASGNRIAQTDAEGRMTTFTYDACGRMLTSTDADGHMTANAYSDSGRLVSVTDALGRVTRFSWTPSGKLAATVCPDGSTVTNIYDEADELVGTRDERGASVTFVRDAEGRVVATQTASGVSTTSYDALGLPVTVTNAAGVASHFTYDGLNRRVLSRDGTGAAWTFGYDLLDWEVARANPLDKARQRAYDAQGRQIAAIRPSGAADRFGYDALGNRVAYTNAEGHVYALSFDALGHPLSVTDAAGRQILSASYDGVGNLTNRVDGCGNEIRFAYDSRNRLVSRRAGTGTDSLTYDAVGNLVAASNGEVAETFSYDQRDRLVSAVTQLGGRSFATAWQRDAGGLVTNLVYAAGKSVRRTYAADGRLVSVADWLGHIWTFSYDGAGNPVGGTSPDGTTDVRTYDAAGRLASWRTGSLAGRTIVRDAAGRRVRDTVTCGPMPRSQTERRATNVFDASDRIVSATVECGAATSEELYFHDGNGSMTNVLADGTSVFSARYDAQGRLAEVAPDGDASRSFAYDALGNRIVEDGCLWVPDHADGLKRPLIECDAAGNPVRYYLWAGNRLLGFIDAAGTLIVAHADEQGSVVALTDVSGNVLYAANYGPHGEDWGASGTNPTPFAWLGGLGVKRLPSAHPSSPVPPPLQPLYLTRHRLYSATLNRFLATDPAGLSGGLNLYAYCEGDPLAYVDPLGLCGVGIMTRIGGLLDMLGGSIEAAVGLGLSVATAPTVAGPAVGMSIAFHGMDVANAGYQTMMGGSKIDTMTSQSLQSVGVPRDVASGIDVGLSLGTVGVTPRVLSMVNPVAGYEMVTVSRWGREGLENGDFVMMGKANPINYLRSGKWQPGSGNQFAPFSSGAEYQVPFETLRAPSEAVGAHPVVDGTWADLIKGDWLGQRAYWG